MNVIIQCPFCNQMLLRDLIDVLQVTTFYCDCSGMGFTVKLRMEVKASLEDAPEE